MTYRGLTLSMAGGLLAGCCGTALAAVSPWHCRQGPDGHWVCVPAESTTATEAAGVPSAQIPRRESTAEKSTPSAKPAKGAIPPSASPGTAAAPGNGAPQSGLTGGNRQWHYCRVPAPTSPVPPLLPPGSPTQLTANQASIRGNRIYELHGNAVMNRPGERLTADHLSYDKSTDVAKASGRVRLVQQNIQVTGTHGHLNTHSDKGALHSAHYKLPARHARGSAQTVFLEGPGLKRLQHATYTTCDPGHDDWLLRARQVKLFEHEGVGVARDVKVDFKGVPILYWPYLSFPINDRRKSGFLIPSLGSSGNSGFDVRVPYYWNIAPNKDATFTPRIMSKRGIMLGTQFRYLNRHDRGELNLEYLPSDKLYGADRYRVAFHDAASPLPHLSTDVRFDQVSDSQYFQDLGNSLSTASTTHLERHAQATYYGSWWWLLGQAQDYQTIDPTIPPASRPYQRMPRLVFQANPPLHGGGLNYHLNAEYVRFARTDNPPGSPVGTRVNLKPQISLPLGGTAYFVKPTLALDYTRYELHDTGTGQPTSPSRTVPLFDVDSGLFLQRNVTVGGHRFLQTLEPRAYYLYVPYRNQSDIPLFDTGLYDFNFAQMFQPNRFSGLDRVGDANQLTVAVTSRLLDPRTGVQAASASLGQIYYFRNRRVTLYPNQAPGTRNSSDLVGEITLQLSKNWQSSADLQWNPHTRRSDLARYQFSYRSDDRHIANFAYRYRRNLLKQTDLSFLWPLSGPWSAVGRWNYSLLDRQTVDAFLGIEYDSCCWAVQVVARNYINGIGGARNHSIYLQLVLKGLGDIGNPVGTLLENGILGYRPNSRAIRP